MIPGEDANEVADDADDVHGMMRTMLPGDDADDIHTRSFMLKMIGDIGVCPLTQKDVL